MSAPAVEVRGLTKSYGAITALSGVDLRIEPGQLVGLLGPNGAGKSTLTKLICGLVRPSAGSATVLGHPAGSMASRARIGYLAELFRFPQWLTPDEVLRLHQRLACSGGGAVERGALLERVGLVDLGPRRVGEISKGMAQRLGLAQAMIGSPQLLLLDEPTSALDPIGRRLVRDILVGLRERGASVLLNSHLLSEVEQVCDSVTIIDAGRVVASGSVDGLRGGRVVEIETEAGIERFEATDREAIPARIRELVDAGRSVYGVRESGSSLEDAYLEAVKGAGE